jgi:hypothetical protein
MAGPRSSGLKIGAAVALAVLGFGASFGIARMTGGEAQANTPGQAEQASVAVLPPEAARLVRLAPAGAVPALKAAATTAPEVVAAPTTRQSSVAPVRTTRVQPTTAPKPAPTTTAAATTYIP